ncbi:ArsR family transcriptional regulator [Amycolatopsis sp. FU40]|uniref:ArsR/SmtB family transcription factor n=1 Tax=Amycolatopsis sp. FU40 TaxID=2914159 RepID=UPI001F0258A8|nr:ArsR family transcriptional regulator [Amycolatopsis sp. FU40]UKD58185.1 ArsR family transcriptional regulator [Amycolatopsis sp. FU40]
MLRIHFTPKDLTRIRLAMDPAPLVETVFSLELLLRRQGGAVFEPWRDLVSRRVRTPLPMLRHLIGPAGLVPAFLGPTSPGLEPAWDDVRTASRHLVGRALRYIDRRRRVPQWGWALADGDAGARDHLVREYRVYHTAAIAPVWPAVVRSRQTDLQFRATTLAAQGAEQLLGGLHSALDWQPPILQCHLPDGPHGDLRLRGQGLRLMPSVFTRLPRFAGDDGTPTIIYPISVGTDSPLWFRDQHGGAQLADLIGRTRATVLRSVARRHSTSTGELASMLDLSPAAVSKHATVLRANGLITSYRDKHRVIHLPTPLGEALLDDTARTDAGAQRSIRPAPTPLVERGDHH